MKQIPLTQGKFALVDDEDFDILSKLKWYCYKDRYACRTSSEEGKTIFMHRLLLNSPKGKQIDHMNGDGLDNRRNNLRVCSRSENRTNSKLYKSNTTGLKGVHPVRRNGKIVGWTSTINKDQKYFYLGYYKTPELAKVAYNLAARKHHGEFARV